MVWFCSWFKSVLHWFALFSALQLCALVCCFWRSPLPSLARYSLLNQQKTISAKGSKNFFVVLESWMRSARWWCQSWGGSISCVDKCDPTRWVSHPNSSLLLGKVIPEMVSSVVPPVDGGLGRPAESQLSIWRPPEHSLSWASVACPRLQRQMVAEPK